MDPDDFHHGSEYIKLCSFPKFEVGKKKLLEYEDSLTERFHLNHCIYYVAQLENVGQSGLVMPLHPSTIYLEEIEGLDEKKSFMTEITYPLSVVVKIEIEPYGRIKIDEKFDDEKYDKDRSSIGYLLWQVAGIYSKIYMEHKKYGVWGHDFQYLVYEGIQFYKGNIFKLSIGS